jgi:hypothetical protein
MVTVKRRRNEQRKKKRIYRAPRNRYEKLWLCIAVLGLAVGSERPR